MIRNSPAPRDFRFFKAAPIFGAAIDSGLNSFPVSFKTTSKPSERSIHSQIISPSPFSSYACSIIFVQASSTASFTAYKSSSFKPAFYIDLRQDLRTYMNLYNRLSLEEKADFDKLESSEAKRRFFSFFIRKDFESLVYILGYRDLGAFHAEQLKAISEVRFV